MHMQEPEQRPFSEVAGTTDQEYGEYRAETWPTVQEQKIYPQDTRETRVSILLSYLTIGFSVTGFGASVIGLVGSAIVLSNRDGSQNLLTGGILGLVGSIMALLLFAIIFVFSLVSSSRRQALSLRRTPRGSENEVQQALSYSIHPVAQPMRRSGSRGAHPPF